MPPVVACLHHLDQPFLGHAEAPLREAGLEIDERCAARGDRLPRLAEVDAIVSFGGSQSAVDLDADPGLAAEATLLREAVGAGVPVLGLCLGAQVLAAALGGRVARARRRAVTWRSLSVLPAAHGDPLVGALPDPIPALHWNEDVFDLPQGAIELLGPREEGVEGFRAGACAWGLQFHPEVDEAALDRWYATYGDWLEQANVDEAAARALDREHLDIQARTGRRLFEAFAGVVAERPRRAA
jgi:GMP synthase-like glutamine amidotransferase